MDRPLKSVISTERRIRWLASYPKSGNTWVRMFLNAYIAGRSLRLNDSYQYVQSDIRPEMYQCMMPRPVSELNIIEQFMYYHGMLLNLIKFSHTMDICVKTHNAKANINNIILIPPHISAASVYLVRDPRDVAISAAAHFECSIKDSITHLCNEQRAGLSEHGLYHMFMSWKSHVLSWAIKNNDIDVLVIKYEDLLEKPREGFKKILEVLAIEYDQERFELAMKLTTFNHLQKLEKEQGFGEQRGKEPFFRVGKAGQWREKLTKVQREIIEDYCEEPMKLLGYL